MLHNLKKIVGYKIRATDDDLGKLDEVYFDDETWFVRYLIVQTGNWLNDRRVLISPVAVGKPDHDSEIISVSLTSERVKNAPEIDTKKPVYRQHEEELNAYYNWPMSWQGHFTDTGTYVAPPLYPPFVEGGPATNTYRRSQDDDPHLRSSRQVKGYYIQALDDDIGHVEDFIIDDENWKIVYIVVETRNFLPGKKVIISPQWIKDINWADNKVYVNVTADTIKNSPEFDSSHPIYNEYQNTRTRANVSGDNI